MLMILVTLVNCCIAHVNDIRCIALLAFHCLHFIGCISLVRSSVDEVIGLLSAPTADGGFEDEGEGARQNQFDPAQFDSWRNSLTKVNHHKFVQYV